MPREFELATYQSECEAFTYRAIYHALSIVCDKVKKEWEEIFEELAKKGESFWNNVELSMLFSQYLNWKLPAFLPEPLI